MAKWRAFFAMSLCFFFSSKCRKPSNILGIARSQRVNMRFKNAAHPPNLLVSMKFSCYLAYPVLQVPCINCMRHASFLTKCSLNISNSTKSKFPAQIVHIIFEMVPMISRLFSCKTAIYRPFHVLSRKLHEEAINVRWEKPEIGWTKQNFDGSCIYKTGDASIGGIFRNHNAEFLLGYAEFIGQSNSTIAELVAMRKGLDHVLQNRWDYVLIEGDSKGIIDVISRKREAKCKEMQMHVCCIRLMLGEIKNYVLSHVFREGNMAADRFSQMGHQLLKPQIWLEPPNEVLDIVKDDAIGKIYYRLK